MRDTAVLGPVLWSARLSPKTDSMVRIVNLWWGASRRRRPRLRAETKTIVIGFIPDRTACGILSLCCVARVQVGRSKNLTPLSDPLFGVKAGPVTVAREECPCSLKKCCFAVVKGLKQVFREALRCINHEGNESLFLAAL